MTSARLLFFTLFVALSIGASLPAISGEEFYLQPVAVITGHLYEGALSGPRGVSFDLGRGELWVADTGNDLVGAFTPDAMPLFSCGRTDRIKEPIKAVVDGRGRLLVLANDRSRISVLDGLGGYISDLGLPGLPEKPVFGALAVDHEGNLYIGENATAQVFVYDKDGKQKLRFGARGDGEGEFQSIAGIAGDRDGIYVVDHQGTPVQSFDRKGAFVKGWGKHDLGIANFSLPEAVALDSLGHVIVVDALRHEIKFFDRAGALLTRFGGIGEKLGEVSFPTDVAVDPENRVYVSEKGNSRVQVFIQVNVSSKVPERKGSEETKEETGRDRTKPRTEITPESIGEGK